MLEISYSSLCACFLTTRKLHTCSFHTIKISFMVSLFRCLQLQQDQVTLVCGVVKQVTVESKMIAGIEGVLFISSLFFSRICYHCASNHESNIKMLKAA